MKILVYTGFDNNKGYYETGLISGPNKAEYAFRHGYDFLCSRNYEGYDRPLSWFKIRKILELLPNYDYIFWSDADAVITNYLIKLEDIINAPVQRQPTVKISPDNFPGCEPIEVPLPELTQPNYIIAQDNYSPCMGNFIIRNCEWSHNFFVSIYNQIQFMNDPIWDNRAQDYLFQQKSDLMKFVKFIPKKSINSMIHDWTIGDFMIHLAATEMPRRVNLMNYYLNQLLK